MSASASMPLSAFVAEIEQRLGVAPPQPLQSYGPLGKALGRIEFALDTGGRASRRDFDSRLRHLEKQMGLSSPPVMAPASDGHNPGAGPLDRLFTKAAPEGTGEPVPFDEKSAKAFAGVVAKLLGKLRKGVVAQLYHGPLGKAAGDDIDPAEIAAGLDLGDLQVLATDDTLPTVASDSAREAIARIGVTAPADLTNQINQGAVAAARDRAGDLVSEITDTTREMIRKAIADGFAANLTRDQIVDNVANAGAFDEDRAELISNTEIARANSEGALTAYKGAATLGISIKKKWLIGLEACPVCLANAAQGPIPLSEPFLSGAQTPPQHPRCRCSLAPTIKQTASQKARIHAFG